MTEKATEKATPTMKLTTLHVHAAGAFGLFIIASLGYAFGYAPSARAQSEAEAQRQAIIRANSQAADMANALRLARAQLSVLRESHLTIETSDADPVRTVSDSLRDRGLVLQDVTEAPATLDGSLLRTPIEVRATGQFSDIVTWLSDLRTRGPAFSVESVSLMAQPMDESLLVVQASLLAYAPQTASSSGEAARSGTATQGATLPDR